MPESDWPELDPLDRRLTAHNGRVADLKLQGHVDAERFVEGVPARVAACHCSLHLLPDADSGVEHQLLMGCPVMVFERREGWAFVQSSQDRYIGWTPEIALGPIACEPTHMVHVPRTFLYREPNLKTPPLAALSMGARLAITGAMEVRGTSYVLLEGGEAVIARHVRPVDHTDGDFVTVAEQLIRTPYLWGGSTAHGLDCSGLVQLAFAMTGRTVLRDSDMQAATLGEPIAFDEDGADLMRGDLVFWRGHVAIAQGEGRMLHANGYSMDVLSEPVHQALSRIRTLFERPIGARRPEKNQ